MQARYQYGSLTVRQRKKGPDVWQFRWLEKGRSRSVLIGTLQRYPTKADAERAVEYLRIKINAQNPQQQFHSVTVGTLIDRFMAEYVPKHCRQHTQRNYKGIFENHIRPRWEKEFLHDVKTVTVEEWLDNYSVSRQVRSHIRNLMHTLFQAAIRWEMADRNPVDLVRQSSKRLKVPRILTPIEFQTLLERLSEPCRTMVVTITCLGLRVSELLGLKWADMDPGNLTVRIQRAFVKGIIYPTKTDAAASVLPIDQRVAELLIQHRARATFRAESDFIFAGANGAARWSESILADHIKPAAIKAGIGPIGWHIFRHTYSTLLHALGTAPAVQKELLRHANIQTTFNLYTQALTSEKREAVSHVADVLWHM